MGGMKFLIALMLITAGMVLLISAEDDILVAATGSTLEVGSGKPYSSIQDAIDNATTGDTIMIYAGTYYENVIVDRRLNITGEGADSTIIDAGGSGSGMVVVEDHCRIKGLGLTNSGGENFEGPFNAGLTTKANNTLIQNCTFYENYMGAILRGGDQFTDNKMVYCEAYENEVHGIGTGIDSTIQACYSHDNEGSGFWAFVTPGSILERCRSEDNGYMGFQFDHTEYTRVSDFIARNNVDFGIGLGGGGLGNNNVIENCLIENNENGGMSISNVEGPLTIINNTIEGNSGNGINFTHGNYGTEFEITGNLIANNSWYGIEITSDSNSQTIQACRNDFVNNKNGQTQAWDANSQNKWEVQGGTYNWGDWTWEQSPYGNFWNEWTTPDSNSDGIVDNPYALDGGASQKDDYPLTNRVSSSTAHLLSNDLWDNGKFLDGEEGTTIPPVGDDDDDIEPPVGDDDDDDIDPPIGDDDDDTEPPLSDYNVSGTPEIEFQNDDYVEGEDQDLKVPEEFAADNDELRYDWYIEGYGYIGSGEEVELSLPEGTYNVTLVGLDNEGYEVFVIYKDLHVQGSPEPGSGLSDLVKRNFLPLATMIVILFLILITFGFALGKRRKDLKENRETTPIPKGMQRQRVVRPGPVGPSMPGSGQVLSGRLEGTVDTLQIPEHGAVMTVEEVGTDLDYDGMKALSDAVEVSVERIDSGTSIERVRSKLDKRYEEGGLDENEYEELSETLDKYMRE